MSPLWKIVDISCSFRLPLPNCTVTPESGSPSLGTPAGKGTTGVNDDFQVSFRMYVAWKWNETVQGVTDTAVYYYLGYVNWQVNFYANSSTGKPPIDTIPANFLHGATADASWTRDNTPPAALDYRVLANAYVIWQ